MRFHKEDSDAAARERQPNVSSSSVLPPHILKSAHMADLKQGWNKADRSHSFTGIMCKTQPFVIFLELEEVHRRANKMIRGEEAALGEDVA